MKTVGIGVDIVDNKRFTNLVKDKKFINRTFSKKEILNSKKISNKINFYSKRFAAKESFAKAQVGINKTEINKKKPCTMAESFDFPPD